MSAHVQDIVSNAAVYADKFWNYLATSIATMSRPDSISEEDWSRIQAAETAHHAQCGRVNVGEHFGVRFPPGSDFLASVTSHPSYDIIAQCVTEALSTRGTTATPDNVVPLVKCAFMINDDRHWSERRLHREFPDVPVEEVDRFEKALLAILHGCTAHFGKGYRDAFAEGARHVGYHVLGAGTATPFAYPFNYLSPASTVEDEFEAWAKANNISLTI